MIPFVKDRFYLDEHELGLLLLCVGIGSFISMPTSGFLSARLGCKIPIYGASFVVALCLACITVIDNIYLMGAILVIFGMGAVTLDVVANINAALVEQITNKNVMSGLHGLYSVGGFLGSLSVTFIVGTSLGLVAGGVFALIVIFITVILGGRSLLNIVSLDEKGTSDKAAAASGADANEAASSAALSAAANNSKMRYYTHPMVLMIGVMCFIMFQTEGSMLDWSGVFLNNERNVGLEYAGYGYAAFAITMTIFRLTGDKIVSALGRRTVIIGGTLLIVAGYAIAVAIPHYISAFVGFALIGMGASNVVPQLVSLVARIKEVPINISVTLVNTIGFTGVLVGPAFIGFLAQHITLPYTYLCQAALVLLVAVLTICFIKRAPATDASAPESTAPEASAAEAGASAAKDSAAETQASAAGAGAAETGDPEASSDATADKMQQAESSEKSS